MEEAECFTSTFAPQELPENIPTFQGIQTECNFGVEMESKGTENEGIVVETESKETENEVIVDKTKTKETENEGVVNETGTKEAENEGIVNENESIVNENDSAVNKNKSKGTENESKGTENESKGTETEVIVEEAVIENEVIKDKTVTENESIVDETVTENEVIMDETVTENEGIVGETVSVIITESNMNEKEYIGDEMGKEKTNKQRKIDETESSAFETPNKKVRTETKINEEMSENESTVNEIDCEIYEVKNKLTNIENKVHKRECKVEETASKIQKSENKVTENEMDKIKLQIQEAKEDKIVKLGYCTDDDVDEDDIEIMTGAEVRDYLLQKIGEYMKDPAINPILALKNQAFNLQEQIREKKEEFAQLKKTFEMMYRDQEKFYRHMGILPKIPTRSIEINVDMPILPSMLPPLPKDGSSLQINFNSPNTTVKPSQNKVPANNTLPAGPANNTLAAGPTNNSLTAGPRAPRKLLAKPPSNIMKPALSANKPASSTSNPVSNTTKPASSTPNPVSNTAKPASSTPSPVSSTPNPVSSTPNPVSNTTKPPSNALVECIDLTDDVDNGASSGKVGASGSSSNSQLQHPAPLPPIPCQQLSKVVLPPPPKPQLKLSADKFGIVLQWDLPRDTYYAKLSNFEIFGYQEHKGIAVSSTLWKRIGSVRAMNLPMACTLTHFVGGYRYHFSIRAVDNFGRFSSYSDPGSIMFVTQPCIATNVMKTEYP